MQVWLCQKMHLVTSVPNSHAWINTCVLFVSVHVCAGHMKDRSRHWCLPQLLSTLVLKPGAHVSGQTGWPMSSCNLSILIFPALGLGGQLSLVLGSKLRSPRFHGKHFTDWIISIATRQHLKGWVCTRFEKGIMIKAGEGLGKKLNGSGLRRANWSCGYDPDTLYPCMKLSMSKLSNIKRIMMRINEWAALTRETSHIYAFGFLKQPLLRDSVAWFLRK